MNSLTKKNLRQSTIVAGQTWIPQPHYQRTGKKPLHIVEVVKSESGIIAVVRIGSATVPKTVTGKRIINHYSLRKDEVATTPVKPTKPTNVIKKRRRNSAQVMAHTPIVGQIWVASYQALGHVKLVEVGESICGIQDINKHGHTLSTVRAVKRQTLMYKYRFTHDTVDAYVADKQTDPVVSDPPEPVEVSGVSDEVIKEFSDRFAMSLEHTMRTVLSDVVVDIIRTEVRVAVEKSMTPYERQNLDETINNAVKSAMAPYDAALRSLIGE